jgi:hypothetical protein
MGQISPAACVARIGMGDRATLRAAGLPYTHQNPATPGRPSGDVGDVGNAGMR